MLEVRDVRTYIPTTDGDVKAVDGVDFSLYRGEAFGIAGESGCGKTMLALSIMGLIPTFTKRIVQGEVMFKGRNLLKCSNKELTDVRGRKIAMIFQEPMTSLNPTLSIGTQISEIIIRHEALDREKANTKAAQMLDMVRIPTPRRVLSQYPHQLSGGMRQRVMIAMALACQPEILIADEPTTALDVTVQAQILDLISDLQEKVGTSTVLITHNLGIIAEFTTRLMVMYLGKVMESGDVFEVFDNPRHPYTQGLLNAIPKMGRRSAMRKDRLEEIKGSVPSPLRAPSGCKFHPRCRKAMSICKDTEPDLWRIGKNHYLRCWAN
ncbi:MAG: ABC transporter ATP-binding protein [Candidatus Hodarchaeota archaeon]